MRRALSSRRGAGPAPATRYGPFRAGPLPPPGHGWVSEVSRTFTNDYYAVLWREVATAWGPVVHLGFRNLPGTDIPWCDKQWIKDTLVGSDRVAVEVFPARERLVDGAGMYHIFCLPPGFTLPFGIHDEEDGTRNRQDPGRGAGTHDRDGWGDGFGPEVTHRG